MTTTFLQRISYDIIGVRSAGSVVLREVIGSAESFVKDMGFTTKTTFLLDLRRQPIHFDRCFLVPRNSAVLPDTMLTTFRVCDLSDKNDGDEFMFGIGTLTPCRGMISSTSPYYELEADRGGVLWKCGKFVALLDPRGSDGFFTLSDAA